MSDNIILSKDSVADILTELKSKQISEPEKLTCLICLNIDNSVDEEFICWFIKTPLSPPAESICYEVIEDPQTSGTVLSKKEISELKEKYPDHFSYYFATFLTRDNANIETASPILKSNVKIYILPIPIGEGFLARAIYDKGEQKIISTVFP